MLCLSACKVYPAQARPEERPRAENLNAELWRDLRPGGRYAGVVIEVGVLNGLAQVRRRDGAGLR